MKLSSSLNGTKDLQCVQRINSRLRNTVCKLNGCDYVHIMFISYRWIILITCWFLSLGLGWTHDRILPHTPLFHLLSWGLPACLTITVLTLRSVDADELTGSSSLLKPSSVYKSTLKTFPNSF